MAQRRQEFFSNFVLMMGDKIREARNERGWSQQRLAEAARLRRATINDIENGKTNPTIDTLLLISGALDLPLITLIPLPPEERAKADELPDWIRKALKHMKDINNKSTQRQIIAMLEAAADVEIKEIHEYQDKQLLEELDRKVAQGEKLSRVEERERRRLKDRYG
jgi:transcriptional regulator with XRE-family HTH domain